MNGQRRKREKGGERVPRPHAWQISRSEVVQKLPSDCLNTQTRADRLLHTATKWSITKRISMKRLQTWSVHQYQTDKMERPKTMPGHGRLSSSAERNKCRELSGGTPQLNRERLSTPAVIACKMVVLGTALMNLIMAASKPPTAMKPAVDINLKNVSK